MAFRVTDASSSARFAAQVATSRQRIATAQEQIASGKRINRPSDDPSGAGIVVRIRTSQAEIEKFERNAGLAQDTLLAGDGALESFELTLDRARSLLTQGASDSTIATARQTIAVEIDSLRTQTLSLANRLYGDQYIFGGTRQETAPYDSGGVPAATPTAQQAIQIDPDGTTVAVGVTAETVFANSDGTIFDTFTNAAAALRGTGDPVADRATLLASLDHLSALADQAQVARSQIGAGLRRIETVTGELQQRSLALAGTADRVEAADFVESATELTESQRAFEAILQTKAVTGRRSLIDLLG